MLSMHPLRLAAIGVHPLRLAVILGAIGFVVLVVVVAIWWWRAKRK
jgi:hypothetical protein